MKCPACGNELPQMLKAVFEFRNLLLDFGLRRFVRKVVAAQSEEFCEHRLILIKDTDG